jgi:cytochrome c551/c552
MPATDQTFYNIKRLHKIFAVVSVLLLCATVWMFAVDHNRPWKRIQRTSDRIDAQVTEWRKLQLLTEDVWSERDRLRQTLSELQSRELPRELLTTFREEVRQEAIRREVPEPSFAALDDLADQMNASAAAAQDSRIAWQAARLDADKARLDADDAAVRASGAAQPERETLQRAARALRAVSEKARGAEDQALAARLQAEAAVLPPRQEVIEGLQAWVADARFREEESRRQRRFQLAELDVAKAQYGLAVRDGKPEAVLQRMQAEMDRRQANIDLLTRAGDTAADHRTRLQTVVQRTTEKEEMIRKKLDAIERESMRLDQLLEAKRSTYVRFLGYLPVPGKKWLELPILDAFNSPRKIDNLWSAGLDQASGSFGRVRRFDRCVTCHQGIQKTLIDAPAQPMFAPQTTIDLALDLPAQRGGSSNATETASEHLEQRLHDLFGIQLAQEGLLQPAAPTVKLVRPKSLAANARVWRPSGQTARARDLRGRMLQSSSDAANIAALPGFLVGDVVVAIDGQPAPRDTDSRAWAAQRLVDAATANGAAIGKGGEPRPAIRVTIRRGLPHPYAGHPRLDLFVGPHSPHPVSTFGCTVCHEGQGSATAFEWTSHAPDDPAARRRWKEQYGWFDNPHWNYPMYPRRFAESLCLKCHHRVVDLEPSQRFPDPPAPKLLAGYRLIRTYGCFGCHDIDGYSGPEQRVAPDLRREPNYRVAALQFKGSAGTGYDALTPAEKETVDRLIASPEDQEARRQVLRMFRDDANKARPGQADTILAASDEGAAAADSKEQRGQPRFSDYAHQTLAPLLKDQGSPGTLRMVGPSLRFLNAKLDAQFLFDWIQRPARFRPTARMPQAFGLWNHLPASGPERQLESLAIYSMATYLWERSQAYDYLQPPAGVTPVTTAEQSTTQIQRGRVAFEQSGCLVCHNQADFPDVAKYRDADAVELGPDLSNTAAKFAPRRHPRGREWLYSWIKQPTRYDLRTMMPDAQLNPVEQRDENGQVVAVTDPVADIVAYLMSRPANDWTPTADAIVRLDPEQRRVLDQLTLIHLRDDFPESTARRFMKEGIPAAQARAMKGPERELIVESPEHGTLSEADMIQRRIFYVARKSFLTHGCFACHDIPGIEDAKPIGPSLTGWGRKDTAQLMFGRVVQYVERRGAIQTGAAGLGESVEPAAGAAGTAAPPADSMPLYFWEELQSQSRIGFIFQKLSEPRSFDFQDTQNKKYTARLRMPQFPLSPAQREAVMTFVLGLVSDPPTERFAYQPDERTEALINGNEVLSKFQCRGCHLLEPETWQLAFPADTYGEQPRQTTYPFVSPPSDEANLAAARRTDRRDLRTAMIRGMPAIGIDGRAAIFDDEEFPLEEEGDEQFEPDRLMYAFDLWLPSVLDGQPYQVGEGSLVIASRQIERRRRSYGGTLAKYLLPHVVERERLENPNAKGSEAWAWLPPPLISEGRKVQPEWLNDYLLDPQPIRPSVVMRMPKYNLSPSEARKLADYFAAKDSSPYPYLAQADARYARQLDALRQQGEIELDTPPAGRHLIDAMRIVTSGNYCVKCHRVGDFNPGGPDRVKAPDLSVVYQRLRADYIRTWIAKPAAVLPYASMPVNIPYDPAAPLLGSTVSQDLYHGTSLEQLDALVDLLMNYDQYARQQSRVAPLVKKPALSDIEARK